jgi:hypothetical protein
VALAGADHELTLPAISDLSGDGIFEEAVLQPIDDKPFKPVEGLAARSWRAGTVAWSALQPLCSNPFMSLMVAAKAKGRTLWRRHRRPLRRFAL